jgi:hypothetical protein
MTSPDPPPGWHLTSSPTSITELEDVRRVLLDGHLIRRAFVVAILDYFPALGPALNRAAGATTTMQKIIEQREAKSDAAACGPRRATAENDRARGLGLPVHENSRRTRSCQSPSWPV